MIKSNDKIFAEELVKRGLVLAKDSERYLAVTQMGEENLKDYLISKGILSEDQALQAISGAFKLPVIDWKNITVEKAVLDKVPVRFAWYYKIMPLKIESKTLTLASSYPLDVKIQDEIRAHLGLEPHMVLARGSDVVNALNRHYGLAADTINRILVKEPKGGAAETGDWVESLDKETDDASVAKLVNQILLEAYKKRATDIHIEPYRNKVRVRYRIDGVLVDANLPATVKHFLPSIISRIKIMANLSIVEKRLPQDGSVIVTTKEQDLDLRISTIPTPRGESMVIRILPSKVMVLSLEKLGLEEINVRIFRDLIKKPHGIILVTGPTGSGKTTTLYACLNEINSVERKIITIEDPVEYEVEGITQIQVNPKANLTFAAGLRSILRHDPNVIMVGEIRDLETAEIAIRTALTGHLVFSTLHTNDAASGITRLIEMGVEPFLVSSSIEAFVAQRLVRIICPKCKEEAKNVLPEIKEEIARTLQIANINSVKVYAGRGCDYCNSTGFYSRTAVYEILVINEEIRKAILEKKRAEDIKQLAIRNGMLTLRQDGWRKVLAGVTTPAEVMNVTVKDDYVPFIPAALPSFNPPAPLETRRKSLVVQQSIFSTRDDYNSRVYQRVPAKVGIRYQLVQQDPDHPTHLTTEGVEHSSITKDISAGGLKFVSGYTLPLGTILELKVHLDKHERSIDCLAKVCRVEDDNLSAMFNLAVYYLDISSADRVKIDSFVRAQPSATEKENITEVP
jgi:type II secretory ATPase GspE/PulE/Tfp pilus assembly ATPase PilB-like protein